MNQTQLGNFESIALAAIRPSPTNPRKHFDRLQLEELARSIGEMGVTNPLLLRPWPTNVELDPPSDYVQYEIVAGERRYRAAELAGVAAVPAIIREMTDAEVLSVQIVENLQRADLHPMEEAEGYQFLIERGANAEDIAKRTGKGLAYVKQRIQLLSLETPAAMLYEEKHLTLDHALLLARLTPADQDRAVRKLLGAEHLPASANMTVHTRGKIADHKKYYEGRRMVTETPGQLKEWITKNVLLQLKSVPFDLGDAILVPEAGPCTTCQKRSGANAALFQDLTTSEDTCADPDCFNTKQKAFVKLQQVQAKESGTPFLKISTKRSEEKLAAPAVTVVDGVAQVVAKAAVREGQWVPAKKGECFATVKALYTDGDKMGKTAYVCANQDCKVHKHRVEVMRANSVRYNQNLNSEENRLKAKQAEELEIKIRNAIAAEVGPKVTPGARMLELFVAFVFEEYGHAAEAADLLEVTFTCKSKQSWERDEAASPALETYLVNEASLPDLHEVAFNFLLKSCLEYRSYELKEDRELLWKLADRVGVDADAIAKRVQAKAEASRPAPTDNKPAKKAAKKAAKKSGSKVDGKSAAAGAGKEATV